MSTPGVPPPWPVLRKCHWSANSGSLGMARVVRARHQSGVAHSTAPLLRSWLAAERLPHAESARSKRVSRA